MATTDRPTVSQQHRAPEFSLQIRQYCIKLCGNELNVGGPNEALCNLIGRRFLRLVACEEGRWVLTHDETKGRLDELFHVPLESTADPATDKQVEYAQALGYAVPEEVTRDEVSFLLTDFQQCRFYVHFVFRSLFDMSTSDAGFKPGTLDAIVSELVDDESLTARILAIQLKANMTVRDIPRRGDVYQLVKRQVKKFAP
jgi:hypothetical protein